MSFFGTTDFLVEVAKGNIEGHSLESIICRNPSTTGGGTFDDLWGGAGFTFPTSAETWEIISSDANDTSAGTGARTVDVISHDSSNDEQTTTVTLNGTTAVILAGTHLRPKSVLVATAGSGLTNAGDLTLRVSVAGATRNVVKAGFSVSQDGHFTIPNGKSGFGVQVAPFFPKNEDGEIQSKIRFTGSDKPFIIGAKLAFYQIGLFIPVKAPFSLPEKADIIFQAQTTNVGVDLTFSADVLLVDAAFVGIFVASVR